MGTVILPGTGSAVESETSIGANAAKGSNPTGGVLLSGTTPNLLKPGVGCRNHERPASLIPVDLPADEIIAALTEASERLSEAWDAVIAALNLVADSLENACTDRDE